MLWKHQTIYVMKPLIQIFHIKRVGDCTMAVVVEVSHLIVTSWFYLVIAYIFPVYLLFAPTELIKSNKKSKVLSVTVGSSGLLIWMSVFCWYESAAWDKISRN